MTDERNAIWQRRAEENITVQCDYFLRDFADFEEVPLLETGIFNNLARNIGLNENTQTALLRAAIISLNAIEAHAVEHLSEEQRHGFLLGLTFFPNNFEAFPENIADFGLLMPHILVTRKCHLFQFLSGAKSSLIKGCAGLQSAFARLAQDKAFTLFDSVSQDEDLNRIYAFPCHFTRKLENFCNK